MRDADGTGMRLNERHFHAGLLDRLDQAVATRDADQILVLLRQVGVPSAKAQGTARKVLGSGQ